MSARNGAVTIPATTYPVERFILGNVLRVVLAPDRSAPVIGVAVVYDVGIRSEPEGRTGFAHLFEHLMFQGSENLEKLAHFRYVQGSGGTFNGSTHLDYTDYFETLPANALERALFLEADRMRGPRLTEENLRNQVDVVKEEIRVNVLNRPYGGFPWLKLPPVMFDTFPNAHDGYGSFIDLESATVPDAQSFFERYYASGNAVLAVSGDLDVAEATRLIELHFGDVPARPAPQRPGFDDQLARQLFSPSSCQEHLVPQAQLENLVIRLESGRLLPRLLNGKTPRIARKRGVGVYFPIKFSALR